MAKFDIELKVDGCSPQGRCPVMRQCARAGLLTETFGYFGETRPDGRWFCEYFVQKPVNEYRSVSKCIHCGSQVIATKWYPKKDYCEECGP